MPPVSLRAMILSEKDYNTGNVKNKTKTPYNPEL